MEHLRARRYVAMRRLPILFAALAMVWSGCSCKSATERADLIAAEAREEYVRIHPDGTFNDLILEGEITHGMSAREVMAAWGLPNVYAVSRSSPAEHWIYFVRDRDALSMLIYTLTFEDDTLRVWDVDNKRFTTQGIAAKYEPRETPLVESANPARKR
jgi:hypothetical protein